MIMVIMMAVQVALTNKIQIEIMMIIITNILVLLMMGTSAKQQKEKTPFILSTPVPFP
jgi:hypothetical protein